MRVTFPVRWMRVRSLTEGWLTINMNAVSRVCTIGNGASIRLLCGATILVTGKEANRVVKKLFDNGVWV